MTVYTVYNRDAGYQEDFTTLTDAKKAMREHNAQGFKTKVYSNGDWVPMGEIKLRGNNKGYIANTRMKKANY